MNRATWLILAVLGLILAAGCWSENNLGALFRTGGGGSGDPGGGGFEQTPGNDGAFGLNSLEPGMLFLPGGPVVEATSPLDKEPAALVDSLIMVRFNESMNPSIPTLQKGMEVVQVLSGSEVSGTYSMAPGSANRIAVFESSADLEDNRSFEVTLTTDLQDAQNQAFDPGEGLEEFTFGFVTRRADSVVSFEIYEEFTYPDNESIAVALDASVLIFFTEPVDTSSSSTGLGGTNGNLTVIDSQNNEIVGTRTFHYNDRMLKFTPDAPMPTDSRITVTVDQQVENQDGERLGESFEFFFDTLRFPHVTNVTFPNNSPLVTLTQGIFEGKANAANQEALEVTVSLEGTGSANKVTLLFWDRKSTAVIEVYSGTFSAGDHVFTIDLEPEDKLVLPDGALTMGVYTASGTVTSPTGPPLDLPDLKKDIVPPELESLGPPYSPPSGLGIDPAALLTDVPDPAFHGQASEALLEVSMAYTVSGSQKTPARGIKFFSVENPDASGTFSEEVTRGMDRLFITEPVDLSGGSFTSGGPPVVVDEIVLTDLVGNTATLTSPTDGSLDFRGYFFSLPVGTGTDELTVSCFDSVTLNPMEGVDVIVENVNLASTVGGTTNAGGTVVFPLLAGYSDQDRVILTLVKNGYEVMSHVWAYEDDTDFFVKTANLLLVPQEPLAHEVEVKALFSASEGVDLEEVYMSGNELITGTDNDLVPAGTNPVSADLKVKQIRLQFLQALGVETGPQDLYHWGWSDPFVGLKGFSGNPMLQAVIFAQALAPPDQHPSDPSITELTQPVSFATVLGSTATRQARLMADLPGFSQLLPLGADFTEELVGSDYKFRIPLPPSLYINENVDLASLETAALDPPYELVIEPSLGPAANKDQLPDASNTLFPTVLSYEVREVGDGSDPAIVGQRLAYDLANLNVEQTATLPAAMGTPSQAGADVLFDHVLRDVGSGAHRGIYKLFFRNPGGTRTWITYMTSETGGGSAQIRYSYPDLAAYASVPGLTGGNTFTDFGSTGSYPFSVEVFFYNDFNLTTNFLSTLFRKWESYWRSVRIDVTK